MKLVTLLSADVYRDGGSFGAQFSTDDGLEYGLWLQRSSFPDAHLVTLIRHPHLVTRISSPFFPLARTASE
jgi:hypothetical protein